MIPKPLSTAIVCLVCLVWAVNFGAVFVVPGYQVDGWVHSIFMTVVGGALLASRRGGGGDPPAGPPGLPGDPPAPPPEPPRPPGAHRAGLSLIPRTVSLT